MITFTRQVMTGALRASLFEGLLSRRVFNFSVLASIACCRARVPPSRGTGGCTVDVDGRGASGRLYFELVWVFLEACYVALCADSGSKRLPV